jgi:hypothetical protein
LGFEVEKGDRLRVQPRGCELQDEVRYLKQPLEVPNTPNCYSFIGIIFSQAETGLVITLGKPGRV